MNIIEKRRDPHRRQRRMKSKNKREQFCTYINLLGIAENLGVVSIDFNEITSYKRRIEILKQIISQVKEK